jgi:hypothetical protein
MLKLLSNVTKLQNNLDFVFIFVRKRIKFANYFE